MSTPTRHQRILGGLLGMAVGDALGAQVEFMPPEYCYAHPVTDLVGGGKFNLQPGQWTDDTSLALCLAESLLLHKQFDGRDMLVRFHNWYENGHLSATGTCFDIGMTTVKHLLENIRNKWAKCPEKCFSDQCSGNGALMRLLPVSLYFANDSAVAIEKSGESSLLTHPSQISVDSCRYFAALLIGALQGASKEQLLSSTALFVPQGLDANFWSTNPLRKEVLDVVEKCSYKSKDPPEIKNSGYVVGAMEAALWAFHNTDSFTEGLLRVVNLGDDSDTVGCIYGQIAGVYYGAQSMRQDWVEKLSLLPLLQTYAEELDLVLQHSAKQDIQLPSRKFLAMEKALDLLEQGYAAIHRKVAPGPFMYRSLADFDTAVDQFKSNFEESMLQDQSTFEGHHESARRLLEDFMVRFQFQERPVVEQRCGRSSMLSGMSNKTAK